ncbi:hypothetical protein GCM10027276_40560 [Comamonas piscis]
MTWAKALEAVANANVANKEGSRARMVGMEENGLEKKRMPAFYKRGAMSAFLRGRGVMGQKIRGETIKNGLGDKPRPLRVVGPE